MKIVVNGENVEVSTKNLEQVLDELDFFGIFATAVNECFVPADQRKSQILSDGDRIEVLAPMQGG